MKHRLTFNLAILLGNVLSILLCASVASQDLGKNEKLLSAIRDGDLRTARALLSAGASATAKDEDGLTALMYAAMFARPDCLDLLLAKGVDPNARSNADLTALMLSIGDPAKVSLLLSKGAQVNAISKQGHSPLSLAAARGETAQVVRILLDQGADMSVSNLLAAAARSGDVRVMSLLLDRGADPNDRNNIAGAAVTAASAKRVSVLSKSGGTPQTFPFGGLLGNIGSTPLMFASLIRNHDVIRLLLARGADVNAKNQRESCALIYAAQMGDPATVRLLLEHGAEVNAGNDRGYTALIYAAAAESNNPELIKALLAGGAEVNVKAKDGETALSHAKAKGATEIVRLLKNAGAKE